MPISTNGLKSEEYLFHNEKVKVFQRTVRFQDVRFWKENLRTLLHFDLLVAETEKPLSEINLAEVTEFLAARPELQISKLAESIKTNGVRVPIILIDDGTLLDGNRRFFACSFLAHQEGGEEKHKEVLENIPALVIRKADANKRVIQKILAEANFVSDYKVEWSLDVKARVVADYYSDCMGKGLTEEQALEEVREVYSVDPRTTLAYLEATRLADEYVAGTKSQTRQRHRKEQVQARFVYFWEFWNKACRGPGALDPQELEDAKKLFFIMVSNDRFKNLKQIEPMVRAKTSDDELWASLVKSKGANIDQVEVLYREQKVVRSAEDKVRNFLRWLSKNEDAASFTRVTYSLLEKLSNKCLEIQSKRK